MANKDQKRWAKFATDPRFRQILNKKRQTQRLNKGEAPSADPRFEDIESKPEFSVVQKDRRGRDRQLTYHGPKVVPATQVNDSESENDDGDSQLSEVETEGDISDISEIDEGEDLREKILQTNEIEYGEETSRIAIVNLDWDNLAAQDLFLLISSFVPKNGQLSSLKIYKSQFGKERMALENKVGPQFLLKATEVAQGDDTGEAENSANSIAALRAYQLERLRYYYAIADFDSVATAKVVYNNADGSEIERTSNVLDLRYVPVEETFDDKNDLHDLCSITPKIAEIRPLQFSTSSLQQSKPKLTWDEDDKSRFVTMRRSFGGKGNNGFDAGIDDLLASSEEESQNESVNEALVGATDREAYRRALLGDTEVAPPRKQYRDKFEDQGITFDNELSASKQTVDTDDFFLLEDKNETKESREEKSQKSKSSKGEKHYAVNESSDDALQSLKPRRKKTKNLSKKERQMRKQNKAAETASRLAPAGALSDDRFRNVLQDHEFAIDPTRVFH